jgi:hypothetical protein
MRRVCGMLLGVVTLFVLEHQQWTIHSTHETQDACDEVIVYEKVHVCVPEGQTLEEQMVFKYQEKSPYTPPSQRP